MRVVPLIERSVILSPTFIKSMKNFNPLLSKLVNFELWEFIERGLRYQILCRIRS
jgi:hypothetical protein